MGFNGRVELNLALWLWTPYWSLLFNTWTITVRIHACLCVELIPSNSSVPVATGMSYRRLKIFVEGLRLFRISVSVKVPADFSCLGVMFNIGSKLKHLLSGVYIFGCVCTKLSNLMDRSAL